MKKHAWAVLYTIALTAFTTYISLDTFVLARSYNTNATDINTAMFSGMEVSSGISDSIKQDNTDQDTTDGSEKRKHSRNKHPGGWSKDSGFPEKFKDRKAPDDSESTEDSNAPSDNESANNSESTTTSEYTGETSYKDENVTIELTTYDEYDTKIYVADVTLTSAEYLKTAFAEDTYGKNVTDTTSDIAEKNGAILAVNGDYYGARESGYVIRNGVVYRDSVNGSDVLCIYANGSMEVVKDSEYTADELLEKGVWQAFSFGPALVEDSEIAVSTNTKVDREMSSNPRTAIGVIDENHFVFVVSDGRTSESEGLSLYELATFMEKLGVETAYNLDGGGSSTMYFNGQVVNNPTTSGKIKEREVSDIVFIS
ncbi:Predicted protein [Butyrivibrio sp. ob235]|uniref:phosphodiester glycosidase family protein n=1 Tax=Butyrivibrio sp. ob235 TaxID=1761780 RepID=UPI0008CF20EE|nr:phosphodiester glycosidase family protein [Butyrivibrio sp. ob235]SEL81048.1 Predicted protein [Butyrivibrio sp. ob235]